MEAIGMKARKVGQNAPASDASGPVVQSGVVPYRVRTDGHLQILLVTNSVGGWIIPKGHIEDGMTPGESACKEALEEAGVVGELDGAGRDEIGSYGYEKGGRVFVVRLFAMRVTRVLNSWPEMHERERAWVSVDEAIRRVEFGGLRDVFDRFEQAAQRVAA